MAWTSPSAVARSSGFSAPAAPENPPRRNAYYQRIGVSFELPNHYQKLTGLENLRFFASLYDGLTLDPMDLLDAVGLAEMPTHELASTPRECRCGSPSPGR